MWVRDRHFMLLGSCAISRGSRTRRQEVVLNTLSQRLLKASKIRRLQVFDSRGDARTDSIGGIPIRARKMSKTLELSELVCPIFCHRASARSLS
jgi:hypothetical protein